MKRSACQQSGKELCSLCELDDNDCRPTSGFLWSRPERRGSNNMLRPMSSQNMLCSVLSPNLGFGNPYAHFAKHMFL